MRRIGVSGSKMVLVYNVLILKDKKSAARNKGREIRVTELD